MKYKILSIIIVVVYFFQTFFISYGGIGSDSLSYFGIAADLPNPQTDLFPLGYPILLKIIYTFSKDYFWASKILNLLFTAIILLFSYRKSFYFRETVLLFTGKTFYFVFFGAMSESPFIFFMYFLFYFLHEIFSEKKNLYLNALGGSLMILCMFACRYSGIYIYLSILLFSVLMFFKLKDKTYFKPLLLFLVVSGFGIGGYLLFNHMYFGSLTGENLRGKPVWVSYIYVVRDFLGLANAVDPFIGIKPASNSVGSIAFQFFVFIIDVFIFLYLIKYYKKAKETSLYYFHMLLWIMACVYGVAVLVSGYLQQIEEMGVRLMAASNFCLFFSFLILYFQNNSTDKLVWRISCFFFIFLVTYGMKDPGNYLKNKDKIQPQISKFKDKVYLYNDEKNNVTVTTYHFSIINKSFKYTHTNSQKGKLKESIAGTVNPKIKWVKYDTVRDRSKVLYTSQLKFD
ncbi:hypothetical protein SAMN05421664_1216 [Chryseobacterium soldanellicola]|uniref:Dolichyl-phosphate-mannose-protein mannosyltransferase n=2 Tax=Chryseobacterium soldanellicola TaxID=311333 RepID=A0A1H1A2R0_9FLAO|nr:hypothetical protein SAMN05421664_1216 [Chryseobacterium soldanellicola]